ncbi:MAG: PD-(D/E)XK nuclease family protein [Chromatiales bacterium]|jgi:probable DNA repair protein
MKPSTAEFPSIDSGQLFTQLSHGALLLTANKRLGNRLSSDYADWQMQQEQSVWPSPQILPLGAWLNQQLENLIDQGNCELQLLSAEQEKLLWQDIIEQDTEQHYLMPATSMANNLQQAWQLIQQWQIAQSDLQQIDSPESLALQRWLLEFRRRCRSRQWLDRTQLAELVGNAIHNEQIELPQQIIFTGFEDINHQQQQLFEQLQQAGCQLSQHVDASRNRITHTAVANSFNHELELAANWARQLLLSKPDSRIAIVVPSLNETRKQVYNCFQAVLHPERLAPPPWNRQDLFNISLGQPLSDYPLVHDALLVLGLLQHEFSRNDLNNLLLSPFVLQNNPDEAESQARLDLLLRRFGRNSWSLHSLLGFLNQHSNESVQANKTLLQRLQQLLELSKEFSGRLSPQQWSSNFLQALQTAGWPGERALDSHEYQQSQRFHKLLGEFRQLQLLRPKLAFSQALKLLRQQTRDCIFQVQSDAAPVQISGVLEALGQQFDYLWMTGLDDEQFPGHALPNPLIPVSIQRHYNLPHCTAEREFDYASRLLCSQRDQAMECVFSHASREQDRELSPSPLLDLLFADALPFSDTAHRQTTPQPAAIDFETLHDNRITALPMEHATRGGSGVLTQQAKCPFSAVAAYRLQAEAPEQPGDGVDARDRGSQLHQALEKLWSVLGSQQQLNNYTPEQLNNLIEQSVDAVLNIYAYKRPDLYRRQFLQLEKQRLNKLLRQWLAIEQQRPASFRVVEREQDKNISIGGLVLRTQVDRIDELNDGSHIIIDYKSGSRASSNSWTTPRISEPQLPLYSLNEDGQLVALTLAQVNDSSMGFKGVALHDDILPGIKAFKHEDFADWQALQQHWRNSLTVLAEQFRTGVAEVTPLDCQYCAYPALCRKHELQEASDD